MRGKLMQGRQILLLSALSSSSHDRQRTDKAMRGNLMQGRQILHLSALPSSSQRIAFLISAHCLLHFNAFFFFISAYCLLHLCALPSSQRIIFFISAHFRKPTMSMMFHHTIIGEIFYLSSIGWTSWMRKKSSSKSSVIFRPCRDKHYSWAVRKRKITLNINIPGLFCGRCPQLIVKPVFRTAKVGDWLTLMI